MRIREPTIYLPFPTDKLCGWRGVYSKIIAAVIGVPPKVGEIFCSRGELDGIRGDNDY